MRRDSIFYKLFQQYPNLLFQLWHHRAKTGKLYVKAESLAQQAS
ncbi:DUF2887 domain-containing protein [Nostoc sp.]